MSHEEAVERNDVERYLLGELRGDARDRFEDHLFDCSECTAELKDGALFVEAARAELEAAPVMFPVQAAVKQAREKQPSFFAWLWQPALLAPALAACLVVIGYLSAVVLPDLRAQVARNDQPTLMEPLVLANAGARGNEALPEITAPRNGSYMLSVDIPPVAGATSYRCTLYTAGGEALWHVDVPAERAKDAVSLQVPDRAAREGVQELRIESVASVATAQPGGDKLVPAASYKYRLSFRK